MKKYFLSEKKFGIRKLLSFILVFFIVSPIEAVERKDKTEILLSLLNESVNILEAEYYQETPSLEKVLLKKIREVIYLIDPNAFLFPPGTPKALYIPSNYGEVGVVAISINGITTVVTPRQETHAFDAGLMPGDKIIGIDGKPASQWEFIENMQGPENTSAVFTVLRDGIGKPMNIKVLKDITWTKNLYFSEFAQGCEYIRFTGQGVTEVSEPLTKHIANIKKSDTLLKGFILDFRYNAFSDIKEAVGIADLFIDEGIIASLKGRLREKSDKVFPASSGNMGGGYPIVVLINRGTAYQMEMIAGALKDHKRALLIGETTFGKGTVSITKSLSNGYGISFSVTEFFTPNGYRIEGRGITPDITIRPPLSSENYRTSLIFTEADPLIKVALEILKKTPSAKISDMFVTARSIVDNLK